MALTPEQLKILQKAIEMERELGKLGVATTPKSDPLFSHHSKNVERAERALARIASGTYGLCLGCGEKIPTPRLAAHPSAIGCVDCEKTEDILHMHRL